MQTLQPTISQLLTSAQPNSALIEIALRHYAGHWEAGVGKKTIPKDQINETKSWIASAERTLGVIKQSEMIKQQAQALGAAPAAQAQEQATV